MALSVGDKRISARHRVHLAVRYGVASEFVLEYAENLSRGGLFIPDAHHLEPLSDVEVQVDLPGSDSFTITGVVAHILTAEVAERVGRKPGAGIEIKRVPKGFKEALGSYLHKLGQRADMTVMVADERCGEIIAEAGYAVIPAPPPEELAQAIAHVEGGLAGLVAPKSKLLAYQQAATASGAGDIVIEMDSPHQIDDVLSRLDQEL